MSNLAYYMYWLAGGLAVIAVLSAVISRHLKRRMKAAEALDALERYSYWVTASRRALFFQGDVQVGNSPVEEVEAIRQECFPELAVDAARINLVHSRLVQFFASQQRQRLRDAESWLDSDHDRQFTELWDEHVHAVSAITQKLKPLVDEGESSQETGTISPA